MATNGTPTIRIAMIGAGIGGLTLAIALSKHNPSLQITIYEMRPAFTELGAGVGFGPNATKALELISPEVLDAYNRVKSANLDPEKELLWYEIFRASGPKVAEVWASAGFVHGGASRAAFLDNLVKLLPSSVEVVFGKKVVSIIEAEGKMLMEFEGLVFANADAVVGCDGVRSACRPWLLEEGDPSANAVYSGKYAYRKVLKMDDAVKAVGKEIENRVIYSKKGGHVLTFPIMDGKGLNVVVFRDAEGEPWKDSEWVIPSSKEELLADFEGWGDKVLILLGMMDSPDKWALFDHPPARTYAKGNFCILGDAAHATTPHCGAGAGMAIEDAHLLSGLMTPDLVKTPEDIKFAFQAYDQIRRPRSQELVRRSRAQGRILDLQRDGGGEVSKEELKMGVEETMKWVWEVDLETMLRDGRELATKCKEEVS